MSEYHSRVNPKTIIKRFNKEIGKITPMKHVKTRLTGTWKNDKMISTDGFNFYHFTDKVAFIFKNKKIIYNLIDCDVGYFANSSYFKTRLSKFNIKDPFVQFMIANIEDKTNDYDFNSKCNEEYFTSIMIQSKSIYYPSSIKRIDVNCHNIVHTLVKNSYKDDIQREYPNILDRIKNQKILDSIKNDLIYVTGGSLITNSKTNDIDLIRSKTCSFDQYKSLIENVIHGKNVRRHQNTISFIEDGQEYQFLLKDRIYDKNGFPVHFPHISSVYFASDGLHQSPESIKSFNSNQITYEKTIGQSSYMMVKRLVKYCHKGFKLSNPEFGLYANCKQFRRKLKYISTIKYNTLHWFTVLLLLFSIDKKVNNFKFKPRQIQIRNDYFSVKSLKTNDVEIKPFVNNSKKTYYELKDLLEWAILTI